MWLASRDHNSICGLLGQCNSLDSGWIFIRRLPRCLFVDIVPCVGCGILSKVVPARTPCTHFVIHQYPTPDAHTVPLSESGQLGVLLLETSRSRNCWSGWSGWTRVSFPVSFFF